MAAFTCNACNTELVDDEEQKLHYRSEWHSYNLKRKVAGVPGVTEALFLARQSVLAEQSKISATPMLYTCALCDKEYRSSKAHAQHLNSRSHILKTSQELDHSSADVTIIKPLTTRSQTMQTNVTQKQAAGEIDSNKSEESEDEWMEFDPNEDVVGMPESSTSLHVNGNIRLSDGMDEDYELNPLCCFVCDKKHESTEGCVVHLHKQHGFFIPDIEYLKDPEGLLTYVGLKVKRDLMCLYCNERCHPFQSLEAVRKHMIAKGHCKIRFGDLNDDEEGELEDFYDYSSSYTDVDGEQLMALDGVSDIELGSGGSELILTQQTARGTSVRILGSREFLRYYRQKPHPSTARVALARSLVSRYRSMGLAVVHSKTHIVRMKVLKQMNKNGVEAMRSKIAMKSNVIRNLPKNVPY